MVMRSRIDSSVRSVAAPGPARKISCSRVVRRLTESVSLHLPIAVVGALLCAAAGRARAEQAAGREIDVDAGEARDAPFAPGELEAALRLRVARDGGPLHVRVVAIAGGVRVETAEGDRDVSLGDLRGAAAARLVALTASDLLLDDVAPLPQLPTPTTRSITVLGSIAGWDSGLVGATIDVAIARGAWLGAIEVGGGGSLGGGVQLFDGIGRLTAGFRTGWVELRAGATIVPIEVTTGVGDTTALVGAGASARLRIPVVAGVTGVLAAGVDAFANRSHYEVDGAELLTTPWVSPWGAVGFEVGL
jgi:hypothetical protein